MLAGGTGALLFALDKSVKASDLELHPPKNIWSHSGFFNSLDHARYTIPPKLAQFSQPSRVLVSEGVTKCTNKCALPVIRCVSSPTAT